MATLKTDQVQDQLRALLDRLLGADPAEYAEFETAPEDYLAKSGFDAIDVGDVDACMPDKYDVPDETRARYDETHPHEPPAAAGDGAGTWEVVREITMYRECLYPEAPYPEGDVIVDAVTDDRPEDRPDEDRYDPDDEPVEPVKDDDEAAALREEAGETGRGAKPPYDDEVVPDRYEEREEADKLREEAIRKYEAGEDLTPEEKALVDEYYDDPVDIDEEPPFTDQETRAIREALIKVEAGQELRPEEEALLARYREAEGQEVAPPMDVEVGAQEPPIDPEVIQAGREAARREAEGEELTKEEEELAQQYRDYVTEGGEATPVETPELPFTPEEYLVIRLALAKDSTGRELTEEEQELLGRYREYEEKAADTEQPPGYGPEYDPEVSAELRDALEKIDRGEDLTGEETEVVKEYFEEQEQAKARAAEKGDDTGAYVDKDEASPEDAKAPEPEVEEVKNVDYGAGDPGPDGPPPDGSGGNNGESEIKIDEVAYDGETPGDPAMMEETMEPDPLTYVADDSGADELPLVEVSEGEEVGDADPAEA